MRHVLAIDLGTSALKVALVSMDRRDRRRRAGAVPVSLLPGGGAEQDPEDWWALISRRRSRLMARGAVARRHRWWPSAAPRSGRERCRWTSACRRVRARSSGWTRGARPTPGASPAGRCACRGTASDKLARWIRKTGGIPAHSGKDSIAHILWLKHDEPETYRARRTCSWSRRTG